MRLRLLSRSERSLSLGRYRLFENREAMKEIWAFALRNPELLYVPAAGFILSLVVIRMKKRYVNEGRLFRRSPATRRDYVTSNTVEEDDMLSENHIDLTIALNKIHELAMADGDLGYAYWYRVGQLLKRSADMQAEIDSLSKELRRYRAKLPKTD